MARLVVSLVVWVWFAGVTSAEPLTPQAFAGVVARAIQQKLPAATVTFKDEFDLVIKDASGRDATVSLANAYKDYAGEPAIMSVSLRASTPASEPQRTQCLGGKWNAWTMERLERREKSSPLRWRRMMLL